MARSLPLSTDLPISTARPTIPIAAKGFRPFFLAAALFAVAIVPSWLLVLYGVLPAQSYLAPATWHAHEMIFGFAVAVIAGFLLTAVGNWTQRETLTGAPLLALAGLWLFGRIAMVTAARLPQGAPAVIDLAFLPCLIVALARPLVATRNRRNFVMLGILAALFAANLVVHLEALGVLAAGSGRLACVAGVDVVLCVILIILGRVLPMFTRNATRVASIRSNVPLDVACVVAMLGLTVADGLSLPSPVTRTLAGLTAVLAVARAWHWGAQYSLRQPLLWILHAGYAWLVLGLALRAAPPMNGLAHSLALHALTVGAIGSLTLGMMARVALGHTGRLLEPAPAMTWSFAAIQLSAFARAVLPLVALSSYAAGLWIGGALWTLAFGIYAAVYLRVLTSPRVDGKPG